MTPSVFDIQENYQELKIRDNKTIHIRKWKVKDRKAFKNLLSKEEMTPFDIANVLVFPCIKEKNTLLTAEEIKFVLSKIREISISDSFTFEFICDNEACQKVNTVVLKIEDINKPKYEKWSEVSIGETTVTFNEKVNAEFYYNKIFSDVTDEEKKYIDLALHIEKLGDMDTLSFTDIMELFDELDTDVIDAIFEEYNKQKFVQDNTTEVKCTCSKVQKFMFDEVPGFLPASWYI